MKFLEKFFREALNKFVEERSFKRLLYPIEGISPYIEALKF